MKSAVFIALCLFLGVSNAQIEISPFVINGVRAPVAPYYVMVNYFNNQGLGFFGGGALVSNRHILTAATNVQGFFRYTAHVGSSNRSALQELPVLAPGSVHPQFNAQSRANDIAILRLATPIIPSADLHPIALSPAVTPDMVLPLENEEGFFVGYGYTAINSGGTNFLKRGYQRVTSNTICSAWFIINNQHSFCALDNVEFANGCNGDVGNPFVVQYRRENLLSGVMSIHPQCGQHSPSAYTRVAFYRQWIDQQLAV